MHPFKFQSVPFCRWCSQGRTQFEFSPKLCWNTTSCVPL